MKLCKTCKPKKNFNTVTTTDRKKHKKLWKKTKKFNTTTEFPHDVRPDLQNIKLRVPDRHKFEVRIKKKELANRYVFYYASNSNYNCDSLKKWNKAYGNFSNSGIAKFDKNGLALLKLRPPQSYIEDRKTYFPHVHFLVSNKSNTKWNTKIYTKGVVSKINKIRLIELIKSKCHMILNALPLEYYIKDHIPNSMPLPHKIVGNKLLEKDVDNYLRKMLVHYPKIIKLLNNKKITLKQIPIIVYCWDENCNASHKLMNKLWRLGYNNILEYPGGIQGWNKK